MKLTEITPPKLKCIVGACPAVYKTDTSTSIIVGKLASKEILDSLGTKVGPGESVIEIKREYLEGLKD